ncbi:MAG: DUF262 domain-containing protein [Nitrospinae bacterium]|nr:DUF262 domain-containing protein [Nitrospinota bacterium]
MRADPFPLETVLGEKQQWVVPVYQRHYEWETKQDKQLPKFWDDWKDKAIERLDSRTQFPHFFGAIICSELPNQRYGTVRQRFLVDGQQRITTFQLALIAIREVARDFEVLRLLDVTNAYLFNERSSSMEDPERECFKLWPSSFDRSLYQGIVKRSLDELRNYLRASKEYQYYIYKNGKLKTGSWVPNLLRVFWYLSQEMKDFIQEREEYGEKPEEVLEALLDGFLSGFQVVLIQLDQNDDAQEIFASLNGLGKPLSPFDLIRNDVFHRAQKTREDAQKLFDERWKVFEQRFWSKEVKQGRLKRARADHLIAHAVVAETAREVNVGKVATEYQHYARERAFPTIAEELDLLREHAATYRAMEDRDESAVFAKLAKVLQIWDMSTFHPLVLWINAQPLEEQDKTRLFSVVESYIVRREICGLTSRNYNKVVTGVIRNAKEQNDPVSAFLKHLASLSGDASRMPSDMEVEEAFARRETYSRYSSTPRPRLRYILNKIEHMKRDKFDETIVTSENLTIEHIMPQSWAENWPLPNGLTAPCESTWEAAYNGHALDDETKTLMDEREQAVATLGNLTLVTGPLNAGIGNSGWMTKRERLGKSLLALNREVAANETWDELAIERRAADLAKLANNIWNAQGT